MPQAESNINFDDLFRYNYRPLCLYALHYLQGPLSAARYLSHLTVQNE